MRLDFSNHAQLLTFLLAVALGAAFCLIYDVLRALRHCVRSGASAVFFEDVVYFTVWGFCTFCFFLLFTKGMLRFYVFLGELLGYVVFRLTLSRILYPAFCKLGAFLITLVRLLLKPCALLWGLLKKGLQKLCALLRRVFHKILFGVSKQKARVADKRRKNRAAAGNRRDLTAAKKRSAAAAGAGRKGKFRTAGGRKENSWMAGAEKKENSRTAGKEQNRPEYAQNSARVQKCETERFKIFKKKRKVAK